MAGRPSLFQCRAELAKGGVLSCLCSSCLKAPPLSYHFLELGSHLEEEEAALSGFFSGFEILEISVQRRASTGHLEHIGLCAPANKDNSLSHATSLLM